MKSRSLLASFVFLGEISAANLTTTPLFPTANGSCSDAVCGYAPPRGSQIYWLPFRAATTITAATVRVIVRENTTRTTTVFNALPSGFELPPTNAAGTRTTAVTLQGSTTELAYPSNIGSYGSVAAWQGALSRNGVCTTATTWENITLTAHPPIRSSDLVGHTTDSADPAGLYYSAQWVEWFAPKDFLSSIMPEEGVFQSCTIRVPAPLVAVSGVRFLTATTTEHESNPTSSSPPKSINTPVRTAAPFQATSSNVPSTPSGGGIDDFADVIASLAAAIASIRATSLPTPRSSIALATKPSLFPSPNTEIKPSLPSTQTTDIPPVTPRPLTINNNVFTAAPGQGISYIINGQTLTPSGVITVDGTTISLYPGATAVAINGQSSIILPSATTTQDGPGFGANPTPGDEATNARSSPTGTREGPAEFTGAAFRAVPSLQLWGKGMVVLPLVFMLRL